MPYTRNLNASVMRSLSFALSFLLLVNSIALGASTSGAAEAPLGFDDKAESPSARLTSQPQPATPQVKIQSSRVNGRLFAATTATSAAQAETAFVRQLRLPTKDLVYDANTQTIFASVPSTAGANGNSITPINPATGSTGASIFVGSEPGRLALADNA